MDTYTDSERALIRAVLLEYAKENQLSVEKLFKRICAFVRSSPETIGFSFKTFQRFLAGAVRVVGKKAVIIHVGDKTVVRSGDKTVPVRTGAEVVAVCARFAKALPGQRLETHRVADCLREFYNREPDAIAGVYVVAAEDSPLLSELTIRHPPDDTKSYIVTERSLGKLRIYDGALVFTGAGIMALLKDRLWHTARVHMLHPDRATNLFQGLVYDDGPLAQGALPYQLLQTTLERIRDAE